MREGRPVPPRHRKPSRSSGKISLVVSRYVVRYNPAA
jgi:hypothetical protein